MSNKIQLAVFASGSGTNAENIINYFNHHPKIEVDLVCTNNAKSGVIERARRLNKNVYIFKNSDLITGAHILEKLEQKKIDYIILAGFLRKIPESILEKYENKIINVHPSLLPKYGGFGMYGEKVHKAVLDAGESVSGISIHLVNAQYDEGKIIYQKQIEISGINNPEELASKIHNLEYKIFPVVIEEYILK